MTIQYPLADVDHTGCTKNTDTKYARRFCRQLHTLFLAASVTAYLREWFAIFLIRVALYLLKKFKDGASKN